MQKENPGTRTIFMGLIWLTAWFAVIAQFFLAIANRTASVPETVIRFFSFFTIERMVQLGMSKVLITIGAMLILFQVISLFLVGISKVRSAR